jgi:hypothetical protein
MTAIFLDIEKAFDRIWHPGLLYKLSKLIFLISPIKLISSFLRKLRFSADGELSTSMDIQLGLPQGSDNGVELQYICSHVFGLQSDSKLSSGFPEGLMNYLIYMCVCV